MYLVDIFTIHKHLNGSLGFKRKCFRAKYLNIYANVSGTCIIPATECYCLSCNVLPLYIPTAIKS